MNIEIDISDQEAPDIAIAVDGPGDAYLVDLGSFRLTVNYEQMRAMYLQLRSWFEE